MTTLEAYAVISKVYRDLKRNRRVDMKKFAEAIQVIAAPVIRTASMRAHLKAPKRAPDNEF